MNWQHQTPLPFEERCSDPFLLLYWHATVPALQQFKTKKTTKSEITSHLMLLRERTYVPMNSNSEVEVIRWHSKQSAELKTLTMSS